MENLHNRRGIANANTGPPAGFSDIFRRELGLSHPNGFARRFSASEVFSISHSLFVFFPFRISPISSVPNILTANCNFKSMQYNTRNAK